MEGSEVVRGRVGSCIEGQKVANAGQRPAMEGSEVISECGGLCHKISLSEQRRAMSEDGRRWWGPAGFRFWEP